LKANFELIIFTYVKGISPVVASILTIIIVIITTAGALFFISRAVGGVSGKGEGIIEKTLESAVPKVSILNVYAMNEKKGVALFFPFEEGYGNTIEDWSRNGNNGTFYGENFHDGTIYGANWVIDSIKGKALKFDGNEDYININHPDFNITKAITMMAWVKRLGDYSKGNPYAPGWMRIVWLRSDTGLMSQCACVVTSDGTRHCIGYGGVIPIGKWVHLALTFENGTFCAYFNGSKINCLTDLPDELYPSDGVARIGGISDRWFNGIIDEVRIYNRVLNESEIKSIYENNTFIRKSLIAYWRFNEGKGNIAHDSHIWADGKFGYALSFDGVDDYVRVPDNDSLDITGELAVEAWVKFDGFRPWQDIIARAGNTWSSCNPFGIEIKSNQNVSWYISTGCGQARNIIKYNTTLETNVWYHFVGVADSTQLRFYLNGKLKCNISRSVDPCITDKPLTISAQIYSGPTWSATVAEAINGTIDEIRIYNRALTDDEVKLLYLGTIKVSLTSEGNIPINGSHVIIKGLSREYHCSGKLIVIKPIMAQLV